MNRNANNCNKNNIPRRHNSTKQKMISPLLLLLSLQLLSLVTLTNAQTTTTNPKECSCSPQTFVFRLALSASCPALPPPFPPNDTFGAGVKDYTCSIGLEPIPSGASQEVTSEDGVPLVDEGDNDDGDSATRRKRKLQKFGRLSDYFSEEEIASATQEQRAEVIAATKNGKVTADMKSLFPEYFDNIDSITDEIFSLYQLEEVPIDELEWSSSSFSSSGAVIPDPAQSSVDVVPVSIYSIQFLEVDSKFNVINQDSSYVRGIDFENGAVFNYTSILSKPLAQTMGVVPGGMNMVLRGVTAAGEPVRNVFTITYTNDCGIQTFEEGDAIGWVVFVSYMSFLLLRSFITRYLLTNLNISHSNFRRTLYRPLWKCVEGKRHHRQHLVNLTHQDPLLLVMTEAEDIGVAVARVVRQSLVRVRSHPSRPRVAKLVSHTLRALRMDRLGWVLGVVLIIGHKASQSVVADVEVLILPLVPKNMILRMTRIANWRDGV